MSNSKIFSVQMDSGTLFLAPTGPVSNLLDQDVRPEIEEVLALVGDGQCRDVLVDMDKASFFGSVLLGIFNAIWKRLRQRQGKLVLCNLSKIGGEIIHAAKFDTLWEIYPTREEALQALAR